MDKYELIEYKEGACMTLKPEGEWYKVKDVESKLESQAKTIQDIRVWMNTLDYRSDALGHCSATVIKELNELLGNQ